MGSDGGIPQGGPSSEGMQASPDARVSFREALRYWVRLGFVNFGGPAGQIAIMHKELVERRGWISEAHFLRALNFCMILPGPEAQQLATYIGWRLHGIWGGLTAGLWFIIPSIFVLLALSWLVAAHGDVAFVGGLLYGVQPAVIAIVAEAVMRIGRRTLHHWVLFIFAGAAFVSIYLFEVPFPLVVIAAALAAIMLNRWWPGVFSPQGHALGDQGAGTQAESRDAVMYPPLGRALKLIALFMVLWLVPVGALVAWNGMESVYADEAGFFTIAAFVTFGGAYAVLSYVADAAVNSYHWLGPGQMVQGLALAESTPGPLIMVTQYVGFLAGWNFHGELSPLLSGLLGALTVTYVTFLPCFMFIFVGAPYIEALAGNRSLQAAFVGVTAVVVGVILNLAVFFGGHVLFPDSGGVDVIAVLLSIVAFIALWRFHWQVPAVVGLGAAVGLVKTLV